MFLKYSQDIIWEHFNLNISLQQLKKQFNYTYKKIKYFQGPGYHKSSTPIFSKNRTNASLSLMEKTYNPDHLSIFTTSGLDFQDEITSRKSFAKLFLRKTDGLKKCLWNASRGNRFSEKLESNKVGLSRNVVIHIYNSLERGVVLGGGG